MFKQKQIYLLIALCAGWCFFSGGRTEAAACYPGNCDTQALCPCITEENAQTSTDNTNQCDSFYQSSPNARYVNDLNMAQNVICLTSDFSRQQVNQNITQPYRFAQTSKTSCNTMIEYKKQVYKQAFGDGLPSNYQKNLVKTFQENISNETIAADCKLGILTMARFISYNYCKDIDNNRTDKVYAAPDFETLVCPPTAKYFASNPDCCTPTPSCQELTLEDVSGGVCEDGYEKIEIDGISCCKEKPVVQEPEVCVLGEPCKNLAIDSNPTYSKESDLTITVEFYCVGSDQQVNDNFINTSVCELITINGNPSHGRSANQNKCVLTLTSDVLKSFNEADIDVEVAIDNIGTVECTGYEGTKTIPYIGNAPAPAACTVAWTGGKCDVTDPNKREQDKGNPTCCRKACKDGESRMKNGVIDEINGKCTCDPNKTVNGKPQCCGVKLNTIVPFIGDCIEMSNTNTVDLSDPNKTTVNQLNAFPILMGGLTKILVTVILIVSFLMIVVGGALMTFGETKVGSEGGYKQGIKILGRVIAAIALLGISGIILKLINPTFFG